MTNVLATIPARAGSKGVKNKNLREMSGKPLVQYAIEIAEIIGANCILTTDIDDLIQNGSQLTCAIRQRPSELCTDTALAWDVWRDAVKAAEIVFGRTWDIHLYLEPTSPCRTADDLQHSIDTIAKGKIHSYCTLSKAPTPHKLVQINGNNKFTYDFDGFMNNKPRQLYEDNWYRKNGIVYACSDKRMKTATTMLDPATHFHIIDRPVINIDTEEDFLFAEALLARK